MKKISIVSSCFNEAENVDELYLRVKAQMEKLKGKYTYEHLLIDNHSTDDTELKLRNLAKKDKHVKVILNARNFGHIRSPYWGMINATGDAIISMASDLQDPPELIEQFIKKWEEGYLIVLGQKNETEEGFVFKYVRRLFYWFLDKINDTGSKIVKNATGFGLYDRKVIEEMKKTEDTYPFIRGLICELGYEKALVQFVQPRRKRGFSKNNIYTLYDIAMLGVVKHSKVPLRLMIFTGFIVAVCSFFTGCAYLIAKLCYWDSFSLGVAPILISMFFLASIQLIFLGILGEYIGAIYTRVDKKPIVVEKERINFSAKNND